MDSPCLAALFTTPQCHRPSPSLLSYGSAPSVRDRREADRPVLTIFCSICKTLCYLHSKKAGAQFAVCLGALLSVLCPPICISGEGWDWWVVCTTQTFISYQIILYPRHLMWCNLCPARDMGQGEDEWGEDTDTATLFYHALSAENRVFDKWWRCMLWLHHCFVLQTANFASLGYGSLHFQDLMQHLFWQLHPASPLPLKREWTKKRMRWCYNHFRSSHKSVILLICLAELNFGHPCPPVLSNVFYHLSRFCMKKYLSLTWTCLLLVLFNHPCVLYWSRKLKHFSHSPLSHHSWLYRPLVSHYVISLSQEKESQKHLSMFSFIAHYPCYYLHLVFVLVHNLNFQSQKPVYPEALTHVNHKKESFCCFGKLLQRKRPWIWFTVSPRRT